MAVAAMIRAGVRAQIDTLQVIRTVGRPARMPMNTAARAAFALTLTAWLGGCATNPAVLTHSPQDPYEKFNRGVYKFNDALDRGVAKPVAHR